MSNKYTNEVIIEQWRRLSGLTPINEKHKQNTSTLVTYEKGTDGNSYAIIKESNKYFLKISDVKKSDLTESDFKYIGGLENKNLEKFDSYGSVEKRLKGKLAYLKEEFNNQYNEEEEKSIEDELMDELNGMDDEPKTAEPVAVSEPKLDNVEATPEPDKTVAPEPSNEPSSERSNDAPSVEPTAEQPSAETDETPNMEEPIEPSDDSNSDSETSGDGDDAYTEIQSLLGKLSNEITKMNDLSAAQTKSILNTVISSTKGGIEGLSDDEKEDLTTRIKKDGKKIDEDLEEEIEVFSHKVLDNDNEDSLNDDNENVENSLDNDDEEYVIDDENNDEDLNEIISRIVNEEMLKYTKKDKLYNDISKIIKESVDEVVKNKLNEADVYSDVSNIIEPLSNDEKKVKELANLLLKQITPEERKQAIDYVKSYQLKEEDEEFGSHQSIMNSIRKNFKSGSKKSIALVALMLFLKFAGTAQAQTSQDNVKDKKNTEVKADTKSVGDNVDNDEYKIETKSTSDNGKSKKIEYTSKHKFKTFDKRGANLKNKAVMDKPFDQLDENKDTEKLEKVWRLIAENPTKALNDGKVVSDDGKTLATNVKGEGKNIVFDFVFENQDSNDYTDGKTPVKILGAEYEEIPGERSELNKVWVINSNKGNLTIDPSDKQHDEKVLQAIKDGYVEQPGTYDWVKPTGGIWVNNGPELKKALENGGRFDYKPFIDKYGAKGEKIK